MLHDARRAFLERLDGPVVATVALAVAPDAVVSNTALISRAMELARLPPELGGAVAQPSSAPDPARPAAT